MKTLNGGRAEALGLRRHKDLGWRSGNLVFPYDEGPLDERWMAPLDAVSRIVAGNRRLPFLRPS